MSPIQFSSKSLSLTSATEHRQVAASSAHTTTYVNCHVVAPACDEVDRKPIDLVVVLDRSGSMSGSKLDLCKQTMAFLARELSPQDRVALVSYDTYVTTDLRLTKMTAAGKALLAQRVEAVRAGSCTNLSGGLLAGLDEVQAPMRADLEEPNAVQSVLLLTDGLANEGVSTKDGLVALLDGVLAKHVSLFTFGYGSDHDADLLRQLSDLGRGSYYFVQSLDGVSLAFADCLGGLLSVVAQNIKVDVVAAPGVSIASIKTKRAVATLAPSQHYQVDLGDMYGQEERDILVQVTLSPAATPGVHDVVDFRLRCANVLTSSLDALQTTATVDRPDAVSDDGADPSVVAQKHRVETAEALEAAQREAQAGNLGAGRARLEATREKLQREAVACHMAVPATLVSDLDECCRAMADAQVYRARGEQRMAGKMQSHWAQRSNDVEVAQDEIELECAAPPGCAAAPAPMKYRNSAKTKMMSKAFDFFSSSSK